VLLSSCKVATPSGSLAADPEAVQVLFWHLSLSLPCLCESAYDARYIKDDPQLSWY
jgi:hypothetical protein